MNTTEPADERSEPRPTRHEAYMIDVRTARIGNLIAAMGTIVAHSMRLEQDEQYEINNETKEQP